jgi:hypothetical protein
VIFSLVIQAPGARMLRALERWTMGCADRINLVSRGFEGYFRSRYPDRSYAWFTNGINSTGLRRSRIFPAIYNGP